MPKEIDKESESTTDPEKPTNNESEAPKKQDQVGLEEASRELVDA